MLPQLSCWAGAPVPQGSALRSDRFITRRVSLHHIPGTEIKHRRNLIKPILSQTGSLVKVSPLSSSCVLTEGQHAKGWSDWGPTPPFSSWGR